MFKKLTLIVGIVLLVSTVLYAKTDKIGLVINKDLYPLIKSSIDTYIADLKAIEGIEVPFIETSFGADRNKYKELWDAIKSAYETYQIDGVTFIGDLPVVDCGSGDFNPDPQCDLYYMDMDDNAFSGSGPEFSSYSGSGPEIWMSRIMSSYFESPLGMSEDEIVNAYFSTVAERMHGGLVDPDSSYCIIGDDNSWSGIDNEMEDAFYYPNVEVYLASQGQNNDNIWKRELEEGHEYFFVFNHSNYNVHQMSGSATIQELYDLDCKVHFGNMYACLNSRYDYANMVAAYALLDDGLNFTGSGKSGSIMPGHFHTYTEPMNDPENLLGDAWKIWWQNDGIKTMSWTSAMVMEGIGTLRLRPYPAGNFLTVATPVAGEELVAGSTVDITWVSNFDEKVSLYLVKGTSVASTIAENVDNNGKYTWTIPEDTEAGSDYKIQMTSDTITSESGVFTIKKKPSIVVETNSLTVALLPSSTTEKKLKISNEGEGALKYSVSLAGGAGKLLVNEIFTPHDAFADGIELWNRGTEMDLKGYKVVWKDNQQTSGEYTFTESFSLAEGATIVIADESVSGNCVTVGNLAWSNQDNSLTELSVAVYDPDGNCVDYMKTAGSSDTPPAGQWDGDGVTTGAERLYRNKNEDSNSSADWSSADGEQSINAINDGQTMDGVGQYWLAYTPKEGTVDALGNIELGLTFNSKGLENGDYYDTLMITHDDPSNESPYLVFCKLTVGPTSIETGVKNIATADITRVGNRIYYQIPSNLGKKKVSIKLYNLQGKLIRTLAEGKINAGYYMVNMNALPVSTGIYLCKMKAGDFNKTVKIPFAR